MNIENPTLVTLGTLAHSSLTCPLHLSRVLYKSTLFMQNKPNLLNAQMNISSVLTKDYENKPLRRRGENKANSKPIKANCRKAKMNVNSLITKDYRKKDDFSVPKNKAKNKPNSPKGQNGCKLSNNKEL